MTAKDLISPVSSLDAAPVNRVILADMPLMEVLPRLLDSPDRKLRVADKDGNSLGIIDQTSMLEGVGRFLAARDDCSTITLECHPLEYSASLIAHAIENVDAHLVDLITTPTDNGQILVTVRVRHSDPTMAVHSLQRHNFNVIDAHGSDNTDAAVAAERLAALQLYLSI